jgi:hypothetical protein
MLAMLALLFLNFMRHARNNEITAEQVDRTAHAVLSIQASLRHPDVVLVGPRHLRAANERFLQQMSGETIWFNVCLSMYAPQPLFDALLRPAIENPMVTVIQLVLDESQRDLWERVLQPRIAACDAGGKVRPPRWGHLSQTVSFLLADNPASGGTEALLSFWGEPFMSQATGRDVPRFIFHVQKSADLIPHLVELERRLSAERGPA